MLRAKCRELIGRARILEAAPGIHVGEDHRLVRAQDLGGLGHEADAAKRDHLGVGRRRLARQIEAVADEIGDVLKLGLLIIMREDDGVALLAQPIDLGAQIEPRSEEHTSELQSLMRNSYAVFCLKKKTNR